MCVRFADMESKLGEIDRSRAIYSYCSQICDPRVSRHTTVFSSSRRHLVSPCRLFFFSDLTQDAFLHLVQVTASFWQSWKEFEIRHGNEDTIREMLRIKRSVQATYNTQVNFMSSQMMKATTSSTGTGESSLRLLDRSRLSVLSRARYFFAGLFVSFSLFVSSVRPRSGPAGLG